MKENKNYAIGFYAYTLAAVFAIIAAVLYGKVMYTTKMTYIFLGAAIAVFVVGALLARKFGLSPVFSIFLVADCVLLSLAAAFGASLMVNQIGYVVAGLDGMDTIRSFIVFEVFTVLSLLCTMVAAFAPTVKAE